MCHSYWVGRSNIYRTPESPYMQLASPVSLNIFIFQHKFNVGKVPFNSSNCEVSYNQKNTLVFFAVVPRFFLFIKVQLHPPSHHGGFWKNGNICRHGVSHPKCAPYGFLKGSYKVPFVTGLTPPKTNMETENHPIERDLNHLPDLHFWVLCEFSEE